MKNLMTLFLIYCTLVMACGSASPQENFETATLNCNMLFGFAGAGMQRELASPSEKLVDEKTYATAPMKRAEMVQMKLEQLEKNFEKVKGLQVEEDSKEMIQSSMALYEFSLPVYKKEYMELAALYDNGAAAENIAMQEKLISEKYGAKFEVLYNAAINAGTAYAAKHGINVQTVNPVPPK